MFLVVFATDEVLTDLDLTGTVPAGAPVGALDVRLHRYSDNPEWVDGFRAGPLRDLAAQQLPDLRLIDDATCCYSIQVRLPDPADLTHLQLVWAVAAAAARAGATAVLDVFAHDWSRAEPIAGADPHRPFTVLREISVVAESDESPGFGHPVHTRGMVKFGRPDLVMGTTRERIGEAAQILNQLAGMLAEGHFLSPGRQVRIDGERTLTVVAYLPDDRVPDVRLIGDGLLLTEATTHP